MTTLRPPSAIAVMVAVPLAPLSFSSTSFAFTVVSAPALVGRQSRAKAAASMSALRNLIMYPPFRLEHRALGGAMSYHSIPMSAADVPWTPKRRRIVSAA